MLAGDFNQIRGSVPYRSGYSPHQKDKEFFFLVQVVTNIGSLNVNEFTGKEQIASIHDHEERERMSRSRQ